jgi:outer membrane receptor for ferrienterochelin and colicins
VKLNQSHELLIGARLDHHPLHGNIFTPRLAYKWILNTGNVLRLNAGTGFRVVNLFTEEHAALTGSRVVIVKEHLQPERSLNFNLNWVSRIPMVSSFLGIDASAWYTYFSNQIIPDYLTNPNQIIYSNLDGYASSKGISLNLDYNFSNRFKALVGGTVQNVHRVEKNGSGKEVSIQPMFTERWSATWLFSYALSERGLVFDYTGNIYGPMQLPLLNELDPRQPNSPVWSIQNLQCTKKLGQNAELYGGIKNLLNWTPARGNPFIIARSRDPFNKMVEYEPNGRPKTTVENPYALSFDPAYVYAPNQGRRLFLGFRYNFNQ